MKIVLGLDPSSRHHGWVILKDGKLVGKGTVNRKVGRKTREDETAAMFAKRAGDEIAGTIWEARNRHVISGQAVYESSTRPMPRARQGSLSKALIATGRLLQYLTLWDIDTNLCLAPDTRKKPRRRMEMSLIYQDDIKKLGSLTEHEADALAIAHRAWSERKLPKAT